MDTTSETETLLAWCFFTILLHVKEGEKKDQARWFLESIGFFIDKDDPAHSDEVLHKLNHAIDRETHLTLATRIINVAKWQLSDRSQFFLDKAVETALAEAI